MAKFHKSIIKKPVSLRDFYNKRNQILLWHDKGGLGDVLMQRMLFEDFKATIPDAEFIFACLPEYMEIAKDHPFISKIIDSRTVNLQDYFIHYNTCVSIADKYENMKAPCQEHRADIWAKYCGVKLSNHDMCLCPDSTLLENCKKNIEKFRIKKEMPIVLFAPISKMAVKTLLPEQIKIIVDATKDKNLVGIHKDEIGELKKLGIPGIYKSSLSEWMCYIAAADYVISVDTAAFHMAGGLKKPLMGIFTFADGKVYGKYYDFTLVQKHRDSGQWDCGPCFKFGDCPKCKRLLKPCLTELTDEEFKNGITELFKKWPWKSNL